MQDEKKSQDKTNPRNAENKKDMNKKDMNTEKNECIQPSEEKGKAAKQGASHQSGYSQDKIKKENK